MDNLKNKTYLFLCLCLVYIPQSSVAGNRSIAQQNSFYSHNILYHYCIDSTVNHKLLFVAEMQSLRSTHGNFFNGASFTFGMAASNTCTISVGVEFASDERHDDNNWVLYHLRFIPVFADERFYLKKHKFYIPYLHTSQGISIINYKKQDQTNNRIPYPVSEQGLYLYGGIGVAIKINQHFATTIEIGLKGFHMSTNILEVNPHGLNFRIGFAL